MEPTIYSKLIQFLKETFSFDLFARRQPNPMLDGKPEAKDADGRIFIETSKGFVHEFEFMRLLNEDKITDSMMKNVTIYYVTNSEVNQINYENKNFVSSKSAKKAEEFNDVRSKIISAYDAFGIEKPIPPKPVADTFICFNDDTYKTTKELLGKIIKGKKDVTIEEFTENNAFGKGKATENKCIRVVYPKDDKRVVISSRYAVNDVICNEEKLSEIIKEHL